MKPEPIRTMSATYLTTIYHSISLSNFPINHIIILWFIESFQWILYRWWYLTTCYYCETTISKVIDNITQNTGI